jgi:MATE family multidrug resistance protein
MALSNQGRLCWRRRCCRLGTLAGPLFAQSLFSWSLQIIATAFVGHLNNPMDLSCAVLASSLFNVSGLSIVTGLASGMETLCGQVRLGPAA